MKTNNALLKLMIKELQSKRTDIIPKGYFSMKQIKEEYGKCETSTKAMIYKAIKDGRMERKMFLALTANGSSHKLPFFKHIKKK